MTAPVAALPLVRRIAEHAYKAGAGLVTPLLSDEEITLARYRFGADASFDRARGLALRRHGQGLRRQRGAARHRGRESRCCWPAQDPDKVARANKANSIAYQPALEKIAGFDINWNIVAYPGAAWAQAGVSGRRRRTSRSAKLADAIFAASRVDGDDPVAAWAAHNAALRAAGPSG